MKSLKFGDGENKAQIQGYILLKANPEAEE